MQSPMGRGATAATATGCAARGPPPPGLTLMRSTPASMRSCSTSFRAWATLLVADIVCHRLRPRVQSCGGSRRREAEAGRPSRSPRPPRPAAALPRLGTATLSVPPRRGREACLSPSSPKSPPVASRGSSPSGDPRRVREHSGGSWETQLRMRWEKVTGVFPDRGPLRGLGGSSWTLRVLRASLALPPSMQGAPRPEDGACPRARPSVRGVAGHPRSIPLAPSGADGLGKPHCGPWARRPSPWAARSCAQLLLTGNVLPEPGSAEHRADDGRGPGQTPALSPGPSPPRWPGLPHPARWGRAGARSAGPIPCSEGCWVGTAPGRG